MGTELLYIYGILDGTSLSPTEDWRLGLYRDRLHRSVSWHLKHNGSASDSNIEAIVTALARDIMKMRRGFGVWYLEGTSRGSGDAASKH